MNLPRSTLLSPSPPLARTVPHTRPSPGIYAVLHAVSGGQAQPREGNIVAPPARIISVAASLPIPARPWFRFSLSSVKVLLVVNDSAVTTTAARQGGSARNAHRAWWFCLSSSSSTLSQQRDRIAAATAAAVYGRVQPCLVRSRGVGLKWLVRLVGLRRRVVAETPLLGPTVIRVWNGGMDGVEGRGGGRRQTKSVATLCSIAYRVKRCWRKGVPACSAARRGRACGWRHVLPV